MDTYACDNNDKVTRKVGKCERENFDSDEDSEQAVSSWSKTKSLLKCPFCSLIFPTIVGFMKHLLNNKIGSHQKEANLSKSQEPPIITEKNLPARVVTLAPTRRSTSPGGSSGALRDHANKNEGEDVEKRPIKSLEAESRMDKVKTYRFSSKEKLDHPTPTQVGTTPHKGQLCLTSLGQLDHMNSPIHTHTDERPHQCELCPKSFRRLSHLHTHIRTHTGERPHQCQLCSKSFGYPGYLDYHIRTHTGERPYNCHLCSKSFGRPDVLRNHIRTHTNERPYQCQLCSKSFKHLGNLKYHMRNGYHTGE